MIYSGGNSIIFGVHDLEKETSGKIKLIVKICKDSDDLTNEVVTLLDLRKIQKRIYGSEATGLIPKVNEFGMLLIKDDKN